MTTTGPTALAHLRSLPSVDRLLGHPRLERLLATFAREPVTDLVRRELDRTRAAIARGGPAPSADALADAVEATAAALWRPTPRRVINATGVVIHTNLGRAPLSADAQAAVVAAAHGYSDLEYDVDAGARGTRHSRVERLITALTGAEAALVVNNNASALLLALASLAHGREVVVSRGEAVEVGGGFRIPDVMRQSGATLVEVGTTNRTYARDYSDAVSPQTAALLKVHSSNFRISGFTHAASLEELVALGRDRGLPVVHDLGSGCLLETKDLGLAHEPMPQESIAAGADLALFSGDKLLGGPQAGIVAGKRDIVATLARHPLARALRMDKLNLAALSATLLHYLRGEATQKVPVWRMLAPAEAQVRASAEAWAAAIGPSASVVEGRSTVGGGSLPDETLPTWLVALTPGHGGADALARRLRRAPVPVIARVADERVLLDPRTVLAEEEGDLLRAVRAAQTEVDQA